LLARSGYPLWQAACEEGFEVHPAKWKQVWHRSASVDLVHAHDAHAHTAAAVVSRRPFVVSRRVAFPVSQSLTSKWKYTRAARFLAISRFVAQRLREAGIADERIDVVYDGVESASPSLNWSGDGPAVALASADPQKGRQLVESAARLARVKILFSHNLPEDLRRASMFVYITKSEGLGSAALLALNLGVPVIASRIGGLPEIIEDGVSGILVENQPEQIATAMDRLSLNTPVAQRLIERGHFRIQSQFTQEHLVQATLASYRRALDG
jgi:glycosyltransferase involved in cell wall biosynthesis